MSRFPLAALFAVLATTVALMAPSAAVAQLVVPKVEGTTLTIEADDDAPNDDDTVVLTVLENELAVGGAKTGLAPAANVAIVVKAGAGTDVVDASALVAANYALMEIQGGEGDDHLIGGAGGDDLLGEGGNDRLVGFRALDVVLGGDGDDLMVWNNGDGPDINAGEAGFDETEVNGSPNAGDEFTFAPGAAAPSQEVLLERVNLITFDIKLTAERLTINGLGGSDSLHPENGAETVNGRTSLVLNGGSEGDKLVGDQGADVLNGGGGADEISAKGGPDTLAGGDGNDTLAGEEGNDRLIGDRGTDQANGQAGDDVLIWNNGDGSDKNEGAAGFDRVEFNGSAGDAAGDVLSLVRENGVTMLRRTAPAAVLTVELTHLALGNEPHGGVEAVSVDGLAGNDSFTVGAGLADLLVAAHGGAGNDVLQGSEEEDSFLGGSGNDTIDPGAGRDLIDGQDGNDILTSRDGFADLVRGGADLDSAKTDARSVDAVDGVELLDAPLDPKPPVADTRALLPQVGKVSVTRKGNALFASVPLSCPAAEAGGCAATVTLQTAGAVKLGKVKAPLVLGTKGTRIGAGQQATVTVRLAAGAGELVKGNKLKVRLRLESSDAAGNSAASASVLSLKAPAVPRGGTYGSR